MLSTFWIQQGDPVYPSVLPSILGKNAPPRIATLGNLDLLKHKLLALFCSVKCPGNLILQTYDLAQQLRQAGVAVIGGFHSPMEQECLTILLRGSQPIIVCPARNLQGMRIPTEYNQPLDQGRLLLLSPFDEKVDRVTLETASFRNRFVAAMADAIFVAHAEPNGKTEQFCSEVLGWKKPLYTFQGDANTNLTELGAKAIKAENTQALF